MRLHGVLCADSSTEDVTPGIEQVPLTEVAKGIAMDADDVIRILRAFRAGPFSEAAIVLLDTIQHGALIHGPRRPIPSAELIGTARDP